MSESPTGTEEAVGIVAEQEQRRLAAVRGYAILDSPPDGAFEWVARLAARTFDLPIATVTIVDEDRIWFKAAEGLPDGVTETTRAPGLCASAILQDEPYVVPDTLRDPQALENPLVRGEFGVRFYASAPIITGEGYRLGTVNVLDTKPGEADAANMVTLQYLAAVVAEQLELRLAARQAVREQEAHLHAVLASRPNTDRAVGMIMAARGCDTTTAWNNTLRQLSQDSNIKVRDLAAAMSHIMDSTDPTALDQAVLHEMAIRALTPTTCSTARSRRSKP